MTNQSPEQLRALAGKLRTFVNQLDSPVLHKALNQAADGVDQAAKAEEQLAKLQRFYDAVMEKRAAGYELLAYDGDSDTYGPDALDDLIKEMQ